MTVSVICANSIGEHVYVSQFLSIDTNTHTYIYISMQYIYIYCELVIFKLIVTHYTSCNMAANNYLYLCLSISVCIYVLYV